MAFEYSLDNSGGGGCIFLTHIGDRLSSAIGASLGSFVTPILCTRAAFNVTSKDTSNLLDFEMDRLVRYGNLIIEHRFIVSIRSVPSSHLL